MVNLSINNLFNEINLLFWILKLKMTNMCFLMVVELDIDLKFFRIEMEVKVNFQVAKILCYITKHLKFCSIYYFCKRILYKIIYVLKICYKNRYPCKIWKVGKHISVKILENEKEKVIKQR